MAAQAGSSADPVVLLSSDEDDDAPWPKRPRSGTALGRLGRGGSSSSSLLMRTTGAEVIDCTISDDDEPRTEQQKSAAKVAAPPLPAAAHDDQRQPESSAAHEAERGGQQQQPGRRASAGEHRLNLQLCELVASGCRERTRGVACSRGAFSPSKLATIVHVLEEGADAAATVYVHM